jgi:hypothetical protein
VTITREQLSLATTRGMRSALVPATNFPDPWPGGLWRPRDIMKLELSAVRSVLSMAAKYRADYVRNFYELGRANVDAPSAPREPIAYLIPAGQGRDEAVSKMVSALAEQSVEVFRLDGELHVLAGARSKGQGQLPPGFTETGESDRRILEAETKETNYTEAPRVRPQNPRSRDKRNQLHGSSGWQLHRLSQSTDAQQRAGAF